MKSDPASVDLRHLEPYDFVIRPNVLLGGLRVTIYLDGDIVRYQDLQGTSQGAVAWALGWIAGHRETTRSS